MGIGVNAYNGIKYYTSDRLTHYLSFGTFYLSYYFKGCEDLLENRKHLVFYSSIEDLDKKIDYYSKNVDERNMIAFAGQKKFIEDYNNFRMTKMMLDVMTKNKSDVFPWFESLK